MTQELHEIAEANHRILDPFTDDKLMKLGEVARIDASTRILDLACGKGEMMCRWAQAFGSTGVGVDHSEVFVRAARARATEFGVSDQVAFILGEAEDFAADSLPFDVSSCLGATWIAGGVPGTIGLLRDHIKPGGMLLIGEPYWNREPPKEAREAIESEPGEFATLAGLLDVFEAAGVDLVEMVLADGDSWDRYVAAQWWTINEWLEGHPTDHQRHEVRVFLDESRRFHLRYQREYLGWGVFVLKVPG